MIQQILEFLDQVGAAINLVAVAVIVVGFTYATARYVRGWRELEAMLNFGRFKVDLGRPLLLGLEILVVSDVIETITTTPTFASLTALLILVLIRTAVAWSLTVEMEGRWPWQLAVGE